MIKKLANETPLAYGELAPKFELEASDGRQFTRSQFRGKNALVLIFVQPTTEAQSYLNEIGNDSDEYEELNVRVFGIVEADLKSIAVHPSITLLADPQCVAWKAYSGTDQSGYAAFMLDLYGGVDAQQVATSIHELPDAKTILGWATAAQYRCNI